MNLYKDIECIILNKLDIENLKKMSYVSKYYNHIIKEKLDKYYKFFNVVNMVQKLKLTDWITNAIEIEDIDILKYLINNSKNETEHNLNFALKLSCETGNSKMSKNIMLLLTYYNIENINIILYEAFKKAYNNYHYNIIKWIYYYVKTIITTRNLKELKPAKFELALEDDKLKIILQKIENQITISRIWFSSE